MDQLTGKLKTWKKEGAWEQIAKAVEAIPSEKRTSMQILYGTAARCYVDGLAEETLHAMDWRALADADPERPDTADWNFRAGCLLACVDREGEALNCFRRVMDLDPEYPGLTGVMKYCRERISRPSFDACFRERVERAWETFAREEESIRALMDRDDEDEAAFTELRQRLYAMFGGFLCTTGLWLTAESGYRIVFHPMLGEATLWPLYYIQKNAPKSVTEHWEIQVGDPASNKAEVVIGDQTIRPEDVQVQVTAMEGRRDGARIICWSEKLTPLLKTDPIRVKVSLLNLVFQVLGDIPGMAVIALFDMVEEPLPGVSVPLTRLARKLEFMGYRLDLNVQEFLYGRISQNRPTPGKDPRLDVFSEISRCPKLEVEYRMHRSDTVDMLYADGVAAGFLSFPTPSPDREETMRFLDEIQKGLQELAGGKALTMVGSALGKENSYLDVLAWDLPRVLEAVRILSEKQNLRRVRFQLFRQDAEPIHVFRGAKKRKK